MSLQVAGDPVVLLSTPSLPWRASSAAVMRPLARILLCGRSLLSWYRDLDLASVTASDDIHHSNSCEVLSARGVLGELLIGLPPRLRGMYENKVLGMTVPWLEMVVNCLSGNFTPNANGSHLVVKHGGDRVPAGLGLLYDSVQGIGLVVLAILSDLITWAWSYPVCSQLRLEGPASLSMLESSLRE